MNAINATNTTITFTANTAWLKPEHNEKVLELNEARDAAYAKVDKARDKAKAKINAQIDRLKAKAKVLDDEAAAAKHLIDSAHWVAVKKARDQHKKGRK